MWSHEYHYTTERERERERLIRYLSFRFSDLPCEYISDAIEDAYIALRKAPEHVLANPKIKYRWVRRVAYRRVLAERKRQLPFVRLDKIQYEIPFEEAESSIENALTVDELLSELSPLLRETAELHWIEGYSIQQISKMLGANTETIKKRCNRAKAELRRIWQADC